MNVINDYSEDYGDPFASVFLHEAAMGWRLPGPDSPGGSRTGSSCAGSRART